MVARLNTQKLHCLTHILTTKLLLAQNVICKWITQARKNGIAAYSLPNKSLHLTLLLVWQNVFRAVKMLLAHCVLLAHNATQVKLAVRLLVVKGKIAY